MRRPESSQHTLHNRELKFHQLIGPFAVVNTWKNSYKIISIYQPFLEHDPATSQWHLCERELGGILTVLLESPNILKLYEEITAGSGFARSNANIDAILGRVRKTLSATQQHALQRVNNGYWVWAPELPVHQESLPGAQHLRSHAGIVSLTRDGQLFCSSEEPLVQASENVKVFKVGNGWISFLTPEQTDILYPVMTVFPGTLTWEKLETQLYDFDKQEKSNRKEKTAQADRFLLQQRVFRMKPVLPHPFEIVPVRGVGLRLEVH